MSRRDSSEASGGSAVAPEVAAERLFDVHALLGAVQFQLAEIEAWGSNGPGFTDEAHGAGRVVRHAAELVYELAEALMHSDSNPSRPEAALPSAEGK